MANPYLVRAGKTFLKGIASVVVGISGIFLAIVAIGYLSGGSGGEPSVTAKILGGVAGVLFVGTAYFIPSIVAKQHHHSKYSAILTLNICLGWTLLGWVAALVWANTENHAPPKPEPSDLPPPSPPAPKPPPRTARRAMVNCRNPVCSRVFPASDPECPGCGTPAP